MGLGQDWRLGKGRGQSICFRSHLETQLLGCLLVLGVSWNRDLGGEQPVEERCCWDWALVYWGTFKRNACCQ